MQDLPLEVQRVLQFGTDADEGTLRQEVCIFFSRWFILKCNCIFFSFFSLFLKEVSLLEAHLAAGIMKEKEIHLFIFF